MPLSMVLRPLTVMRTSISNLFLLVKELRGISISIKGKSPILGVQFVPQSLECFGNGSRWCMRDVRQRVVDG